MPRATLPNECKKPFIRDRTSVMRSDINIVKGNGEIGVTQKSEEPIAGRFRRDDPENRVRLPNGCMLEQAFDVFEAGNSRHALSAKEFPEHDHEPAVGNRQSGDNKRAAI